MTEYAAEADAIEQQQVVSTAEDEPGSGTPMPSPSDATLPAGDEADLREQGHEVPVDDDYYR